MVLSFLIVVINSIVELPRLIPLWVCFCYFFLFSLYATYASPVKLNAQEGVFLFDLIPTDMQRSFKCDSTLIWSLGHFPCNTFKNQLKKVVLYSTHKIVCMFVIFSNNYCSVLHGVNFFE